MNSISGSSGTGPTSTHSNARVRDLTAAVQLLARELERQRENEAHEREKMLLRLENELLRFERRLPRRSQDDSA
ncbi:hypothetical protein BH23GEM3_BH23GEM3_02450 [soil metagenome]